jgi:hypothetical protein
VRMSRPAVALVFVLLTGCLTVESTLRSDGSATLTLTYRSRGDTTEYLERRRYSSPYVHVESVKIYEDQRTVLRATVDDVTRLSTAEGFRSVIVSRTRDGDDQRLVIRLLGVEGLPANADARPVLRLGITLPGPVRDANHSAVVSGDHVAWVVSVRDYADAPEVMLTVRWRPPPPSS